MDEIVAMSVQEGEIGIGMQEELFAELVESVRDGGAILRGEKEPSRTFVIAGPDVKSIREQFQLTQTIEPIRPDRKYPRKKLLSLKDAQWLTNQFVNLMTLKRLRI